MTIEYPKIETLFDRDEVFAVDPTKLRCPEFAQINDWLVTEKIDGTNIRVTLMQPDYIGTENAMWKVRFDGKTDSAQIPAKLIAYLQDTFTVDALRAVWRHDHDPYEFTLYGEGYGAGIQSGGNYRADMSFRLFDVLVSGKWWLDWANVVDVADKLNIEPVPALGRWSLENCIDPVQAGLMSMVAAEEKRDFHCQAEGIVARTDPYLYDKNGNPLKFKLKTKDFRSGKHF